MIAAALKFSWSRAWQKTGAAGLTGLLLGSLLGCGLIVWNEHYSHVVVHEARELGDNALREGHLDLYIDLDRIRNCPSETSRWLWTWVEHDGEKVKQFFPLANTTTTLSDIGRNQHFILSLPVPKGIWPGQWYYWSKTIEHCSSLQGLFRNSVRESIDIPIRITERVP